MLDIREANILEIQHLENFTNASVRIGNHCMEDYAPTSEFLFYRVILEKSDTDRMFVLFETGLTKQTLGQTCRLKDIVSSSENIERVKQAINGGNSFSKGVDLKSDPNMELELVASELYNVPLTIIDGNHRAIAHYIIHGSVQGVPAYICVHKNISKWPYIPPGARM